LCLDAKIAQLTDTFQAKLGSILGRLYNRVAAPEWNEHYPDNKVGQEASNLLKKTLRTIDEDKIAEGVADLKRDDRWEKMKPGEVREYITRYKITSKRDQVKKRAVDWFCGEDNKLVDLIRGRVEKPLKTDGELASGIDALLEGAGVPAEAREEL